MSNIGLARNFKAEAAIAAFTIVKHGATDGGVVAGAAATDSLIGVTTDIPAAVGERCDVIFDGIADVLFGGVVTRGDLLTSDGSGRAIKAVPGAGVNNRIIGVATVSGVLGDVGQFYINHSSMQG